MDQCEDREEGVPPSKTTLCGEHESQTKAQRKKRGTKQKHEPGPSCVSLQSDRSKDFYIKFKADHCSSAERVDQERSEVPSGQSAQQHQTHLDSIFMMLEDKIISFVKNELKRIHRDLRLEGLESCSPDRYEDELLEGEDEEQSNSSREAFVKITVDFLKRMKQKELAECLQSRTTTRNFQWCQPILKSKLKKKFQCVFEVIAKAGNPTLLNQIYTELYITEGGTAEVNDEHEVRKIETAFRKQDRPETTIRQEDIFKASPGRDEPIRTVLTNGVAGIGKTLLRLLPVVKASNKALLSECNLCERSYEALCSVLSSQSSSLEELDLSNNDLQDSGVKLLSAGLRSPTCTLKSLSLSGCLITEEGCTSLTSALSCNPSHLRELDLSYNHPGKSGINLLMAGLKDPRWRLDTLRVEPAGVQWLTPGLRKCKCVFNVINETKQYTFNHLQTGTSLLYISDGKSHHENVNQ
ncbi:NACHT, LRR and PYD domains-containing protein 3-like [Simochromis diagramma]|uniref:NACHT, LRR and PYD domains-containing protein 3-like n=1 Tax=Simochromis diagramma TaxID=43689 RepID=UPI001A7E7A7C|nr:NACHT, LRR and PYD domains-containing protein 3-like [Simochromis diagramma]